MSISKNSSSLTIETLPELTSAAEALLSFAGETKVFVFSGEMGAGKTTFIKAICTVLGVSDGMSSPSFAIINEYTTAKHGTIYHFDFYRIKEESEAFEIGVEEYFESGRFCMIEWPEKIINLLPEPRIRVDIQILSTKRLITFSYE